MLSNTTSDFYYHKPISDITYLCEVIKGYILNQEDMTSGSMRGGFGRYIGPGPGETIMGL